MIGSVDSLREAVQANPQDRDAKRVYADWLEEYGRNPDLDRPLIRGLRYAARVGISPCMSNYSGVTWWWRVCHKVKKSRSRNHHEISPGLVAIMPEWNGENDASFKTMDDAFRGLGDALAYIEKILEDEKG